MARRCRPSGAGPIAALRSFLPEGPLMSNLPSALLALAMGSRKQASVLGKTRVGQRGGGPLSGAACFISRARSSAAAAAASRVLAAEEASPASLCDPGSARRLLAEPPGEFRPTGLKHRHRTKIRRMLMVRDVQRRKDQRWGAVPADPTGGWGRCARTAGGRGGWLRAAGTCGRRLSPAGGRGGCASAPGAGRRCAPAAGGRQRRAATA
mmetsp:Transcript_33080/g.103112  ORF Transcript_33080/g.103112 Transcript_33080/m.103112 type:complete len:209 (-) Transcript_33080:91-717(-)